MRNRRRSSETLEDNVNQAGWMYADLFLALMVIFLATISFVPEQLGKANSSTSERVSSGYFSGSTFNYDLGFTYLLKTPEVSPLRAGITDFLAKKKLHQSFKFLTKNMVLKLTRVNLSCVDLHLLQEQQLLK